METELFDVGEDLEVPAHVLDDRFGLLGGLVVLDLVYSELLFFDLEDPVLVLLAGDGIAVDEVAEVVLD